MGQAAWYHSRAEAIEKMTTSIRTLKTKFLGPENYTVKFFNRGK